MNKKILFITILLFNSVIVLSQEKKNTSDSKIINNQNAKIGDPGGGECPSGYGYLDNDGDGSGSGPITCLDSVLDENLIYVPQGGDCNDNDPYVTIAKYWYLDADGDGFGNTPTSTKTCYPPNATYKAINGDCNDNNPLIHPNTAWYVDADHDGFVSAVIPPFIGCTPPIQNSYYTLETNIDCNDNNTEINPNTIWYIDADTDNTGSPIPGPNNPKVQCSQPVGYVLNNTDCNDNDDHISGLTIFYADSDGDSFGDPNNPLPACSLPTGYVTNNLDACPTIAGALQGCVVPNSSTSFGTRNYIITTTPKVAVTNTQNITLAKDVAISITYYDELGKPNQHIANQQSNSGKDIITHIAYDNYNRQVKEFLPFKSNSTNMAFDTSAEVNTLGYPDYSGQSPFSEKQFESSPLNRVFKQAAPGTSSDWAMGSGHEIKFDYLTNTSTDAVKLFVANATWNTTDEIFDITLSSGTTNYADNQLIKTVTKDENWVSGKNNTTEEFKDKEGKVILKRTYSDYLETSQSEVPHDTYYVYDQYNNLTYVIPPLVANATSLLDGLCYQYKYDNRNRLVEKKLPGKQWEFIVYDKLDRVVATGPALSPFSNDNSTGWLITKYDAFNRSILTAWQVQTGTFTSTIRKTLQVLYNNATVLNETKSVTDTTVNLVAFRYTNNALPTTGYHVLTVNYYDDYNFTGANAIPLSVENQPVYYNNTIKPIGLTTSSWVRVLETSNDTKAEKTVIFYDEKARPIRTNKTNHLGGFTQVDSNFQAFSGRTNYTFTSHKKDANASPALITVKDEFTYSDQDRLTKHTQELNGGPSKQLIASHAYNELGELTSKYIGGSNTTGTTGLQKVNFKYNIRGWLTEINDITNLSNGSDPQDLFAFKINYNQVQNQPNYTGIPMFNGNISETYWKSVNDNKIRKYGYKYDNLNRLKDAVYMQAIPVTSVLGNYNESLTYDKNGNIITLKRTGGDENPILTNIDALTYGYEANSNKLVKVDDASNNTAGFNNLVNLTTEYYYDNFGNMTKDDNKGISGITYNHLNLPKQITLPTGNITYIYNALGQKVSKVVAKTVPTSSTTATSYLDGFQYTGNTLEYFPHAEGYVATGNKYVFHYKDHLGNVRVSFKESSTPGVTTASDIIEEDNYYPFGLKHDGYNIFVIRGFNPGNKYKYNGKELQEELGLNMYDYGARNYDPSIGRWMNMDPLAETSRRWSPYNYAYNNPIFFVDPDGMENERFDGVEYKNRGSHWSDAIRNTEKNEKNDDWKKDVHGQMVYDKTLTPNSPLNFGERYIGTTHDEVTYGVFGFYTHKYYQEDGSIFSFDDSIFVTSVNDTSKAELAQFLQNSGDAAIVLGTLMCFTGVAAPFGAGLITYGGYMSTAGTILDVKNDYDMGTWNNEKVATKLFLSRLPGMGGKVFNKLGTPNASRLFNLQVMGADKVIDGMRETKSGAFRD